MSLPHRQPFSRRQYDLARWDAAPHNRAEPWHPPYRVPEAPDPFLPVWRTLQRWLLYATCVLSTWMFLAIFDPFSLSVCNGCPIATRETAAIQNLKALATAQTQYHKRTDHYAASARDLNGNGLLIATDLAIAFQACHNNGDRRQPTPKAGYVFRMLQGDTSIGAVSFYNDPADASQGLHNWGVIARAAEPGVSGENQFLITSDGVVYKKAEPPQNSTLYQQFRLDAVPYVSELNELGWTLAK